MAGSLSIDTQYRHEVRDKVFEVASSCTIDNTGNVLSSIH